MTTNQTPAPTNRAPSPMAGASGRAQSPGRANTTPEATLLAPGRVIPGSETTVVTPGRAKEAPKSNVAAPGRAIGAAMPRHEPPGRANPGPLPTENAPGRASTPASAKRSPTPSADAPVRAATSGGAIAAPIPKTRAPRRTKAPAPFRTEATPVRPATGRATTSGQAIPIAETMESPPDWTSTPAPTSRTATPKVGLPVRATTPQAPPRSVSAPIGPAAGLAGLTLYDPALYLLAAQLDNVESLRIAAENRHRQATRSVADVDGHLRGLGLPDDNPAVIMSAAMVAALQETEHKVELALAKTVRKHPLGPWQKTTLGVGEKQLARLLAAIGDPYWNETADKPRRVSDLWSYCGVGDAAKQVRKRGERANWSATAKFRSWLIASKCVMTLRSPFRPVYDAARTKYAEAVHVVPCVRCGPAGKPAAAGSPLSLGHQHARGLRAVQKELLRALWLEARRLHTPDADQSMPEIQRHPVGAGLHLPASQPTTGNQNPSAGGINSDTDQPATEAQTRGVSVGLFSGVSQESGEAQRNAADAGPNPPAVDQAASGTYRRVADGGVQPAAPPPAMTTTKPKARSSGAARHRKAAA